MKRVLLMLVMALAVAASAHAAKTGTIGVVAGLTLPFGDLGDAAGAGFNMGGEYCYHVSDVFGVGGDLVYHKLGNKDVTVGNATSTSKYSTVQYGVHAKYMIPSASEVHPYLKAGLGLYSGKVSAESNFGGNTYKVEASHTDFGLNFGGGADWKLNETMSWGVNGAYHYISSSGNAGTMISLDVGLKWGIGY